MAIAVLPSHDCLTNPHHLYFYGSRPPPTGIRPLCSPPPQNKPSRSPPSNKKPSKTGSNKSCPTRKKQPKSALLPGQVTILKRGEDLKQLFKSNGLDLSSISKMGSESDLNVNFAGPVFVASPPASDVPIPTFLRRTRALHMV